MQRVFATESDFLAAPPATRRNRSGYRVHHGSETFYVWATSSTQAMGLVAREKNILTTSAYKQSEVRHHEAEQIDPKLLAAVVELEPGQQTRLLAIIRRDFRE
jgi:hypothetical protein